MLCITAVMREVQLAKCYIFAVLTAVLTTPVLKYGYQPQYAIKIPYSSKIKVNTADININYVNTI